MREPDPKIKRQEAWQERCRRADINPREVRLIYERYEAYRIFTETSATRPVPLDQWFRFYLLEKTSEGQQAGIPVHNCSAEGDSVNDACLRRPGEFLEMLRACDAARNME